jgi:hypothetical protein
MKQKGDPNQIAESMTSNREKRKSLKLGVAFNLEETGTILSKIPSEAEVVSPVSTATTAVASSSATTNTLRKGILNRGASYRSILKKEGL